MGGGEEPMWKRVNDARLEWNGEAGDGACAKRPCTTTGAVPSRLAWILIASSLTAVSVVRFSMPGLLGRQIHWPGAIGIG